MTLRGNLACGHGWLNEPTPTTRHGYTIINPAEKKGWHNPNPNFHAPDPKLALFEP